jgi:hypothetical protein
LPGAALGRCPLDGRPPAEESFWAQARSIKIGENPVCRKRDGQSSGGER